MAVDAVNQKSILDVTQPLVAGAQQRVWVTAPWITNGASGLLFDALVARLAAGQQIDFRVVYRLKGVDDLSISDLEALDRLEAAGCQVRYSNRLHAKLVLVDDDHAVVSSSNLTSTAGYSANAGAWQNEELGVHVSDDPALIAEFAAEFEAIWATAHVLSDATVGIALDPTSAQTFRVACMREPVVGEFVTVGQPPLLVGQVTAVSAFNPSVPAEEGSNETQLGLRGGGGGSRSQVPGVETLFAHPSKSHAFLMAQTFVQPSASYRIADVAVLKSITGDAAFAASVTAVEPGEIVCRAAPELLDTLISGTQGQRLLVGTLPANPAVEVTFDRDQMLRLHTCILGMTGSGKSNAVKVMLGRLLDPADGHGDLRVVVIDTHDEYNLDTICDGARRHMLTVNFHPCVLDEEWVRRAARTGRQTGEVIEEVEGALQTLGTAATPATLADALDEVADEASAGMKKKLKRLVDAIRGQANLRLDLYAATEIVNQTTAQPVDFAQPGMYVLNLRDVHDFVGRTLQAGAVARAIFLHTKLAAGAQPALLVVDEAQNYAPEQQTGRLSQSRGSFEPIFEVATEGRKFNCGLLLASQRPARVNNDVLSQCNTQLVFRMVNMEDLAAVKDSFEAASSQLLETLPAYDTGTCYAAGVALAMGSQVHFPEFAPGH